MSDLVWYAAYGSNLSRERFDCYLEGGTPSGSSHRYPGCRDPSPPVDDRPGEIDIELAFGGASRTWGGGVAFVRPGAGPTLVRRYLIGFEQFEDVVAQENWLDPGTVTLPRPLRADTVLDGPHTYGVVMVVGTCEDRPVVTLSQSPHTPLAAPTIAYMRHIATGLREAHGMGAEQVAAYLASRPGVGDAWGPGELAAAFRE